MTKLSTSLRLTRDDAKQLRYRPGSVAATNVQDAIDALGVAVVQPPTQPAVITATTVNFAASPYTVQPTDFLLEVDTSGGVVVINPQAVAARTQPLEIKDVTGNAGTNNIQITGPIEGLNPYLIDSNFGAVNIRPNKARTAYEVTTW